MTISETLDSTYDGFAMAGVFLSDIQLTINRVQGVCPQLAASATSWWWNVLIDANANIYNTQTPVSVVANGCTGAYSVLVPIAYNSSDEFVVFSGVAEYTQATACSAPVVANLSLDWDIGGQVCAFTHIHVLLLIAFCSSMLPLFHLPSQTVVLVS
jgi:hypothetical protein